eukprot:3902999-Prymnesium_polylepis.1
MPRGPPPSPWRPLSCLARQPKSAHRMPHLFPLEHLQAAWDSADRSKGGDDVTLVPWLEAALAVPGVREAVPSLNAVSWDRVPDGALVRFCGMIQDVQDPEFYEGAYQESDGSGAPPRLVPAKYRDGLAPVPGR